MAKRDTVTSSCLDLGLRAILTNQQSGESTQDTQTELTFIKKSAFAELAEAGAGQVMDAGEQQVKALADQARRIAQQKRQLQARQGMAKAQERMRQASKQTT